MEIIDSHTHWGPSVTLSVDVTTAELLGQARQSNVARIVILPFPSQALADEEINESILAESEKNEVFIPYYYIPEDLRTIPKEKGFCGGKWHWTRGVQDYSSNYRVLEDPSLQRFIEESEAIDLPIIFEEELAFTEAFVRMTKTMKIIIPHLGLLGGNPLDFLEAFKTRQNVYFDTALAGAGTIKQFVDVIGPERVIFGSDIPFGGMKSELDKVLYLSINDADKELILCKNIKRLIGLD